MLSERIAIIGLSALVVAGVIAALLSVGGPGHAAKERRDDARLSDISQLRWSVECLADQADGTLPETFDPADACNADRRTSDPFTGADYGYARVDDDSFRLCVEFELPERAAALADGRLGPYADGCFTVTADPRLDGVLR